METGYVIAILAAVLAVGAGACWWAYRALCRHVGSPDDYV
jgi:hypothetical protein